jgi:hypothetical protein
MSVPELREALDEFFAQPFAFDETERTNCVTPSPIQIVRFKGVGDASARLVLEKLVVNSLAVCCPVSAPKLRLRCPGTRSRLPLLALLRRAVFRRYGVLMCSYGRLQPNPLIHV